MSYVQGTGHRPGYRETFCIFIFKHQCLPRVFAWRVFGSLHHFESKGNLSGNEPCKWLIQVGFMCVSLSEGVRGNLSSNIDVYTVFRVVLSLVAAAGSATTLKYSLVLRTLVSLLAPNYLH